VVASRAWRPTTFEDFVRKERETFVMPVVRAA
jgi:hypothetical protein